MRYKASWASNHYQRKRLCNYVFVMESWSILSWRIHVTNYFDGNKGKLFWLSRTTDFVSIGGIFQRRYPYRSIGTPPMSSSIETPFPCLYNCTGGFLAVVQTDSLLQYTADRAVIQTGERRLNWWWQGCLCIYKEISSLVPSDKSIGTKQGYGSGRNHMF